MKLYHAFRPSGLSVLPFRPSRPAGPSVYPVRAWKTINKYLGKDYVVMASYGHIRDLPSKDGSVKPDEDFSMQWDVD